MKHFNYLQTHLKQANNYSKLPWQQTITVVVKYWSNCSIVSLFARIIYQAMICSIPATIIKYSIVYRCTSLECGKPSPCWNTTRGCITSATPRPFCSIRKWRSRCIFYQLYWFWPPASCSTSTVTRGETEYSILNYLRGEWMESFTLYDVKK